MQTVSVALGVTTALLVLLTALRLDALEIADQSSPVWDQPAQINELFPDPISDSNWRFDFEPAENLLESLRFTQDHQIVLDEATTILMKRLYNWQSGPENQQADPARVQLLISKFFPEAACYQSFSDLWGRYVTFKQAEKQQTDLVGLQTQFFSQEEIEGLFGRQNRLSQYLSARTQLIKNPQLTDVQREQALQALVLVHRTEPDSNKAVKNGPCS